MANMKMTQRSKRTEKELLRASLAVQYEVVTVGSHLKLLLDSNTSFDSPPEERAVSNALLNNLLLAARSLLSFLYSYNPRPADLIAEDFFDDAAIWHDSRPDLPDEARDGRLCNDISKRLAHLTWSRASGTKRTWGLFAIAGIVTEALEAFTKAAPKGRLHAQLCGDVAGIGVMMRDIRDRWGAGESETGPLSTTIDFDEAAYFEGRNPFVFDEDE